MKTAKGVAPGVAGEVEGGIDLAEGQLAAHLEVALVLREVRGRALAWVHLTVLI